MSRDPAQYAAGPGRQPRAAGPVIEVYADGAIDRQCTNCGAEPLQFCRYENGALRMLPCATRTAGGAG